MLPTSALVEISLAICQKGNLFEKGTLTFQQGAYCRMIRIRLSLCFWGGAALRRCVCSGDSGEGLRGEIQH